MKVLGPGCPNCQKLAEIVNDAVKKLGIDAKNEKITDMVEILKYTMSTPGLVINGNIKHKGKPKGKPLPDLEKVKSLINEEV
ncbi:MAG: thioredoxin family protein [Nitrospirota bacterium]